MPVCELMWLQTISRVRGVICASRLRSVTAGSGSTAKVLPAKVPRRTPYPQGNVTAGCSWSEVITSSPGCQVRLPST